MSPGRLIVLEGMDAAGKGTQLLLLRNRLEASGLRTATFSFPRYASTLGGRAVRAFLSGDVSAPAADDWPAIAALYALDRLESRRELSTALREHDVVLCDRYVPSNVAYTLARVPRDQFDPVSRWVENLEYATYVLPVPDLRIWLDVPVDEALRRIAARAAADTSRAPDRNERRELLERVRVAYAWLRERAVLDGYGHGWLRVEHDGAGPEAVAARLYRECVQRLRLHAPRLPEHCDGSLEECHEAG